jgi:RNA polymerase sigma-70 factor (ECF subfamily)
MTEPTPDFLRTPEIEWTSAFTTSAVDLDTALERYYKADEADITQEGNLPPDEPSTDTPDTLLVEETESSEPDIDPADAKFDGDTASDPSPDAQPDSEDDASQPSPERPRPSTPIHPETLRIVHGWAGGPRLQNYVRSRMGGGTPEAAVDDICQEVVLALIKGWRDAPPDVTEKEDDEKEHHWRLMYGIAAHKIADHFRRMHRNRSDPVEELPDTQPVEGAENIFFEGWDKQHIWEVAARVADTPAQRDTFEMMMTGLKAEEKGEILGRSPATVRVSEFRLRNKIEKAFRREFGGQEIGYGYIVPPLSPEESAPRAKGKKIPPPLQKTRLPISEIRDAAIYSLHAACKQEIARGGTELPAHIPAYIGAWTTAIATLDLLREDDTPRPSAIIFPHTPLLPAFRAFVNDKLDDRASLYRIETPEAMAAWLGTHSLEFVAAPDDMDEALEEQLRAKSSFILRLLQESPPEVESEEEPSVFNAPSYRSLGLKGTLWSPVESVYYLQEWRFATGRELTEPDARRMGGQGLAPNLPRIIKGTSFPALRTEAGYDAPD